MNLQHLLLYCRPGFESECAAEIMDITAANNLYGYVKAKADSGYVLFTAQAATTRDAWNDAIAFNQLVFARQMLLVKPLISGLPVDDRITPLLDTIGGFDTRFCELHLETPDTNDGKQLSGFCRKFTGPLRHALEAGHFMDGTSPWRLHLLFLNSSTLYAGVSRVANSSPLPMGIPRLRMPGAAPSRSTLKLEEALLTLLDQGERKKYLRNGMTAVDLGASPGGWSWQLVQRGIRVAAIDNGPMDQALLDSGLLRHIRADGFKYQPPQKVDWLVCDMVERPLHISRLVSRWLLEGYCDHAVFNLKLPMKQRYAMVNDCRELISEQLGQAGMRFELRMKQLYHDREEITCVLLTGDRHVRSRNKDESANERK
jgi:23S rRNA (cytidine2498-2'-O)-methyltransferase